MNKRQTHNRNVQYDALPISIRAFVPPPKSKQFTRRPRKQRQEQSEWTLVFDTETKTDAVQSMRFGVDQLYNGNKLNEAGIFFDAEILGNAERSLLEVYASKYGLKPMTKAQFVDDVFYGIAYELLALQLR